MSAPSNYNQKYHDDWAWSLAAKGATNEDIAEAMGVSIRTIIRWSKTKDENGNDKLTSFGEALQIGKEIADSRVERKLFERTQGYEIEEKENIIEVDKDGNTKPVKIRTTKKHVPPDVMAIMYWLNNRKKASGEWSQTQNVKLSGSVQGADLSKITEDELRTLAKLSDEEV